MAKVLVIGNDQRREYELGPVNTLGRHPDNSMQILDRIVSKEHAQIIRQPDGRFLFRDLGSLNGSYLRGERVSEHILREGDEITLGSTRLTYFDKAGGEAEQKVTIAPAASETLIRQKIQAPPPSREFLPEKEIFDVDVLRRDYEKLRLAAELGRAIGLERDLDVLLEKIIMKSFELIPADRGVILLMENGQPKPRIVRTRDGKKTDEVVLSRSIINEVVNNKASVLSSDATMDSRFSGAHSIIMSGIRSTMTVPLLHHGELLGIMHMDSMIATNAFVEKDLQVFASIAGQAAVAIHNSNLAREIEQEAKTRAQFQRLLSPNLVDQVVKGQLQLEKGGSMSEITMLFSDIRGFTAMSESREPPEIVRMLNEYFELMVDVIFKYEGTLDKFVGDEIIALFGAPVAMPQAELKAVECALEMLQVLKEFNRVRVSEGQHEIKIGIGINTGRVVTGAIGSSRALQYTAIGDAVNTSARLCSVAKSGEIILSEHTYSRVRDQVEVINLPPVRVKGKSDELRIYNAVGLKSDAWKDEHTRPT